MNPACPQTITWTLRSSSPTPNSTALSPYSEVYVGRPLSKGKLSFDVHTLIDHNAIKVDNDIFFDQFTLGAWNDSPKATHLPVKLAVNLLKDRNGRITLDIPVSGQLNDPKFSVWPLRFWLRWKITCYSRRRPLRSPSCSARPLAVW